MIAIRQCSSYVSALRANSIRAMEAGDKRIQDKRAVNKQADIGLKQKKADSWVRLTKVKDIIGITRI